MNIGKLFRGKRVDNGEWVKGYLMDENYINQPFNDNDVGGRFDEPVEVIPETVGMCNGRCDISGQLMFEGDIFEAHQETQILAVTMVLRYGVYQAYCPSDKEFMDNVGFYAEAKGYPDMPVGDTESYAKVIGNIHDNKELLKVAK